MQDYDYFRRWQETTDQARDRSAIVSSTSSAARSTSYATCCAIPWSRSRRDRQAPDRRQAPLSAWPLAALAARRELSERSSQNYMQMARKFSELQKSNPKQHSDFIRLSYREALKACQEHIDPAPSEPRLGITLLGETTARPGITYPHNLHAPTTETETSDETEDAPQKIVNLVAGPTGEPTEVVQLTSRSSPRAMTLALLDRLHSCLKMRAASGRTTPCQPLFGTNKTLLKMIRDETWRRQDSRR